MVEYTITLTAIEAAPEKQGYYYIKFTGDHTNWLAAKHDMNMWHFWWNPQMRAWRVSEAWLLDSDIELVCLGEGVFQKVMDITAEAARRQFDAAWQAREKQANRRREAPSVPKHVQDSYQVLGVSATATSEDIKRAYRALSKKCHPDTGGTERDFIALGRAYERAKTYREALDYRKVS